MRGHQTDERNLQQKLKANLILAHKRTVAPTHAALTRTHAALDISGGRLKR